MLGIRSLEAESTVFRGRERALRRRAGVVRVSVGVVAQRLMEAVMGGWVEELWRAAGVLVCMVDRGGWGEGGDEEWEGEEWL